MDTECYCVIDQSGNVVNTIVWDGVTEYNPGADLTLVQSDIAGIGWTYENGEFTNPNIGQ